MGSPLGVQTSVDRVSWASIVNFSMPRPDFAVGSSVEATRETAMPPLSCARDDALSPWARSVASATPAVSVSSEPYAFSESAYDDPD
jgi:hypothetical protein